MTVRIWQSFSCNNSSNFRLVARFAEPMVAAETAAEIEGFLAAHVKEIAAENNRRDESYAGLELADKYGLDPDNLEMHGNGVIGDIEVAAIDGVLALYHDYSLGFGQGFRDYLKVRGAATVEQNAGSLIELSVLFEYSPDDPELVAEIDALVAQNDRPEKTPFVPPWEHTKHLGRLRVFRDAGTAGMFVSITPEELPKIRAWLSEHDLVATLRLCEGPDYYLFDEIGKARCTACAGPLQYLDPRIHDIETPQLVCKPCGGLYDLSVFTSP